MGVGLPVFRGKEPRACEQPVGSVPLREKGDDRLGHRITASPDSTVPLEGLTQLSKPLWTLGGCSLLLGKAVALSVLWDGPSGPRAWGLAPSCSPFPGP